MKRLILTGLTALALLFAGSGVVAGQTSKTATGDLLVSAPDGRSFVQRSTGERVELPLSAGARISDFRAAGEDWLVAAVGRSIQGADGPRLELLRGHGANAERLASPALEPTTELLQPTFVADRQGFQALVWLAGDAHHRLAVQASRWVAGGWGPVETLSPPGPGTQIAPTTAILGDGSWLVAWAAFDGKDDEILWSRYSNGTWSAPKPLAADNAVPDITPHLVATDDGALAAWSRFDGNDYRVHVARFEGERWSEPTVVGPAGSTSPWFSEAQPAFLTYRQADPPAWGVLELAADGAVRREATALAATPQRPVLSDISEQSLRFEWPRAEQRPSAAATWIER